MDSVLTVCGRAYEVSTVASNVENMAPSAAATSPKRNAGGLSQPTVTAWSIIPRMILTPNFANMEDLFIKYHEGQLPVE
jgi:hypothetical protein